MVSDCFDLIEDRDTEDADRNGQAYWPGIEHACRFCTRAVRRSEKTIASGLVDAFF
jgi:hypothetical protein